jgi:hypothetical protein
MLAGVNRKGHALIQKDHPDSGPQAADTGQDEDEDAAKRGDRFSAMARSVERERHVADLLHRQVVHVVRLHLQDVQRGARDDTGVRIHGRDRDFQSEHEQSDRCDGDDMTDCAHDGASFRDIALHCLLVRCSENVIDPDQISAN